MSNKHRPRRMPTPAELAGGIPIGSPQPGRPPQPSPAQIQQMQRQQRANNIASVASQIFERSVMLGDSDEEIDLQIDKSLEVAERFVDRVDAKVNQQNQNNQQSE